MSRFLPADHSKGDETTVGGYEAVHARPAALDAPDGFPYSIAQMVDAVPGDPRGAWAAYLMFLRWRRIGEEGVEGHVESEYLEFAATRDAALQRLGAWPLARAQELLNGLLAMQAPPVMDSFDDDEVDA